uniref:Uncharacterized protein n=1 Tax=Calcidiscus leptoporus TaxID=127549 RepID=A0A7S0P4B5_9EUKA|mmetsp:Transcript_53283/g.122453  ORF Transcript_53283/g.122453 Transcript_53283/m.122453 type:complete len:379 (+) Transcript_53283:105-1241(+)
METKRKSTVSHMPPAHFVATLRSLISTLLEAKKKGHTHDKLQKVLAQGSGLLLELRAHDCDLIARGSRGMDEVHEAKERVEASESAAAAQKFERMDCLRGLRALASGDAYAPPEGLLSSAELKTLAPPWPTARNEHEEMLQRLAAELRERRRLCAECKDAVGKKRERAAELEARRAKATSVSRSLEGLLPSIAALQEDMPEQMQPAANALAARLPAPLHMLWCSAAATVVAHGSAAEVSIFESDPMIGDSELFVEAPLGVSIRSTSSAAAVHFRFFPVLRLIGVHAAPPALDEQLRALVHADDGASFPNERSALLALEAVGDAASVPALDGLLPCRPYRWAQWATGCGPLHDEEPLAAAAWLDAFGALLERLASASLP